MTERLLLYPIPANLHAQARECLNSGNVSRFLCLAPATQSVFLVLLNAEFLLARGLYEAALLKALTANSWNNAGWSATTLRSLLAQADRVRLRAAGDPLPGRGPFTVYRGVAGRGARRRVRGLSWTFSLPRAAWFARRSSFLRLPDPAVYRVTVHDGQVLAYLNESFGDEEELLVLWDRNLRPVRCLAGEELARRAEEHESTIPAARAAQAVRLEALKAAWQARKMNKASNAGHPETAPQPRNP
jgi:hypothetical protein